MNRLVYIGLGLLYLFARLIQQEAHSILTYLDLGHGIHDLRFLAQVHQRFFKPVDDEKFQCTHHGHVPEMRGYDLRIESTDAN